ncbi:MAG: hypothetical protein EHM71_09570, partial [Zetaproteobacteria bacterium]
FQGDPETDAVLMIGEIGGSAEEEAAAFVRDHVTKPVIGFICGQTAPPGRRMGHAGAIISGGSGTAAEKMAAMRRAGIRVVKSPAAMGETVARALASIRPVAARRTAGPVGKRVAMAKAEAPRAAAGRRRTPAKVARAGRGGKAGARRTARKSTGRG